MHEPERVLSLHGKVGDKHSVRVHGVLEALDVVVSLLRAVVEPAHHRVGHVRHTNLAFEAAPEEAVLKALSVGQQLGHVLLQRHRLLLSLGAVKNVKKQRIDINKILVDVRNLNKEINTISETRGRSFAVADELIFSDAKKNPTAKSGYRHLAAMNENFRKLGSNIEEEGSLKSNILDLEAKIEQIQQRTSSINMEHIVEDLKQIKKENEQLQKQIKKKGN